MKYSAHILAGQCAHTIVQCLESVKFADEIVIVFDTRSTDETYQRIADFAWSMNDDEIHRGLENNGRQIGKFYIYPFDWKNDSFADARNFGLSKCKGEWIIAIDADEVLEDFEVVPDNYDYALVTVSKEGLSFRQVRLWKNDLGLRYKWARHNQIDYDLKTLKQFESGMHFRGFTKQPESDHITKARRLLKRHFRQLEEEPDNYTLDFHICSCYYKFEEWEKCKAFGHMALQEERIGSAWHAQICIYLGIAYLKTGFSRQGDYWINVSANILPEQLWAWCLLYERQFKAGNFDKAEYLKQIILSTETSYLPVDMTGEGAEEVFNKLNQYKNEECKV